MRTKTFTTLIIAALLLCSCGGGNRQQTTSENETTTVETVEIVPFDKVEYFSTHEVENENAVVAESAENVVIVSDDERIITDIHEIAVTASLDNYLEYFRQNNRFSDWDANDARQVLIRAVINRDGTSSYVGVMSSSGIEKLDNEAIRLIQEGSFTPGRNAEGEIIRMGGFGIPVFFPPR